MQELSRELAKNANSHSRCLGWNSYVISQMSLMWMIHGTHFGKYCFRDGRSWKSCKFNPLCHGWENWSSEKRFVTRWLWCQISDWPELPTEEKKKKSPSPNETCSASYASKISINNNNSKKNSPASAEDIRDTGSIPGSGRFPGEGIFNPLQYSCLGNPMDRGAWQAAVHGVMKSQTQLSMHECIHKGWLLMDR